MLGVANLTASRVNMFWGTVVEPGALVVIAVPPTVVQLRITKAVPYELYTSSRHRVFLETQTAPPILICNNVDGCSLDINLSRSDLDRAPALYQTNGECHWALSGEAIEDTSSTSSHSLSQDGSAKDRAKEAAFLAALSLLMTLLNSGLLLKHI